MMNPLVSIIVPTYNGGEYLADTLRSAMAQSLSRCEILVVDDGSDEDIKSLIDKVGGDICYIRQNRSGPAAARNHGLRKSRGEFIAFLDHDDLWESHNLETLVGIMHRYPACGLVYSYPTLIDGNGCKIPHEPPTDYPSGKVFEDFLVRNRITSFSAVLIRKHALDTVNGLDESPLVTTCDDYDLWLRIADLFEVRYAPGELVHYRVHAGNFVKNYDLNLSAHLYVYEKALKENRSVKMIPHRRLKEIVKTHLYDKYRNFAYKYYYEADDRGNARDIFMKMLRLKPWDTVSIKYTILCSLPVHLLEIGRRMRTNLNNALGREMGR